MPVGRDAIGNFVELIGFPLSLFQRTSCAHMSPTSLMRGFSIHLSKDTCPLSAACKLFKAWKTPSFLPGLCWNTPSVV